MAALWYNGHPAATWLAPLEWLFRGAVACRRAAYRSGLLATRRLAAPVVVVGNLCVGGGGKTPLVIWLAGFLLAHGYRPGVLCRGYGGGARCWPARVTADSDARLWGDEAVLLARRTGVPVVAGADRHAAGRLLLADGTCDLVLCDDGLQHLGLARDLEIAVLDGELRHGNGRCLPAGPLREPPTRLALVDLVVARGSAAPGEYLMRYRGRRLCPLASPEQPPEQPMDLAAWSGRRVHAVAGIAHPESFFRSLEEAGLCVERHAFPDHHPFRDTDLYFRDDLPVLMTEKDAVKCARFARPGQWFLPIEAEPGVDFGARVLRLLEKVRRMWTRNS